MKLDTCELAFFGGIVFKPVLSGKKREKFSHDVLSVQLYLKKGKEAS